MRRIVSVLAALAVVAAMVAVMAIPAFAHTVGDHQHFLETPSEQKVAIGPNPCGDSQNDQGFQQFHHNVHNNDGSVTPVQNAFAGNDVDLNGGVC